jgi:hypothetical protein
MSPIRRATHRLVETEMARKQFRRLVVVGCGLAVLTLIARHLWTGAAAAPATGPVALPTGGYVGSAACRNCHPDQHASWHASYHRTMTQPATEESVLGDFNDVRLSAKELDVHLFKQNGQFMAELNFHNPEIAGVYPVVLTTGSHNRQAYWMADPIDAKLMILPYMYLKAERRWIPRHSGYLSTMWQHRTPEKDIFKGEYGRWAVICIKCHTTHGQSSPVDEAGTASAWPRVAEFGISCEACHGPGEAHARAKHDPSAADIVHPLHLAHDRSSQVCGQCHSVFFQRSEEAYNKWLRDGYSFRPGDDLFADPIRLIGRGRAELMPDRPTHVADPATSGAFWPDGMIRVTGREFNGLIESPCYQRGEMSCLSCHQMHQKTGDPRPRADWAANQLKPGMDGNHACVQCHDKYGDAGRLIRHTHHPAESPGSLCYNCHMPYTTYGILKAARSHQIHSPNVAQSQATGRPNACAQCHQDKTLGWAADNLTSWYKQPKPKLSADEEQIAASVLGALRGDAGQRAITAWSFGWPAAHQASGTNWQAPYLAQLLDDPYDAVRFVAHRSLKRLPGFADFEYDFIGPPSARTAAVPRARTVWEQARTGGNRPFAPQTLIDLTGHVRDADLQRLLKLRDDRPIDIAE